MASSSQESVKFELECDISDDEFLENVDFHLVESLVEKQKSIPQDNTSPLTAVENMMLRGDSLTISSLARDSVFILLSPNLNRPDFWTALHLMWQIL